MTTETKVENPKKRSNYNKILFWVSISFFVIFIILLGAQWYCTNKNINEIEETNKVYFEKIQKTQDYGPFQIDIQKINKKQVIINSSEVDKINNHIKTLTEQADKESNRAKEIIDRDIDRLNLYMLIGIGFLTLMGVFVPIMINILSFQDLKDKNENLESEFNKLNTEYEKTKEPIKNALTDSKEAIELARKALEKSKEVDKISKSVSDIESQMEESFPKIKTLTLQYAIIRYLSIAPYINPKDRYQYNSLLETIRDSFGTCKSSKISITTDYTLKNAIKDFSYFITDPRNQLSFFNRNMQTEFTKLAQLLKTHVSITDKDIEVQSYDSIITKIDDIIKLIQPNAQNKPTA